VGLGLPQGGEHLLDRAGGGVVEAGLEEGVRLSDTGASTGRSTGSMLRAA